MSALGTKPSLVDLVGCTNPALLKKEIDAVKAAGSTHHHRVGRVAPNGRYRVPLDFVRAGRLLADRVIMKYPTARVLVLVSDEYACTKVMRAAIEDEFHRHGARSIQYKMINVILEQRHTVIPPVVLAAVADDPKLTYVIGMYDSMVVDIAAALAEARVDKRIKIIGFNETPDAIDLVRTCKAEMVIAEGIEWSGYAIADAEMRILAGLPVPQTLAFPFRIFTRENAAEAGVPAQYDEGFGTDYKHQFLKLWQVPAAPVARY